MKLSYNWLKSLLPIDLSPQEVGSILTEIGLEVESIQEYCSHKGLDNVVVGHVIEKKKHPNADKLSLTKVNVGNDKILDIVCGAPNVDVNQKVLVAMVGAHLQTFSGESIEIKKSKIRGEVSEGMICAEDELGISNNHDGIMVLNEDIPVGLSANDYFKVEKDFVFEIGLTANRGDAASHIGIARDLKAYLKVHNDAYKDLNIGFPSTLEFPQASGTIDIQIDIQNAEDCKRYAGIVINGIKIAPSPQWIQNRLNAVGIRPINNVVDITNFVMMELGQPLHAFDVKEIKEHKIIVRNALQNEKFITLDGIERTLTTTDLMICNAQDPMCIAGVFGGLNSGIKNDTQAVFIESAWFNPSSIRKTASRLGIKTESSFRFERFADPEMAMYALNRAYLLITEFCGGALSMVPKDIYPQVIESYKIGFSIAKLTDTIGQEIPFETTKNIIQELDMQIESESHEGMLLLVPARKSDITREIDVIEEVLRIYGYNQINAQKRIAFNIPDTPTYDTSLQSNYFYNISKMLAGRGFYEFQNLSFHNIDSYNDTNNVVKIQNPVNVELNILRKNLLFNALQNISFNERHQTKNLTAFEIGKIYHQKDKSFIEEYILSLFGFGKNKIADSFYQKDKLFFFIKENIEQILKHSHLEKYTTQEFKDDNFSVGLKYFYQNTEIATLGFVNAALLKKFEIDTRIVVYGSINLEAVFAAYQKRIVTFKEITKFPVVTRDLSLLIDQATSFEMIKKTVEESAKKYLIDFEIFDYYEGKNIPENKKSYAIRLSLQDKEKTLTDKEIEKIMSNVIQSLTQKHNAQLR